MHFLQYSRLLGDGILWKDLVQVKDKRFTSAVVNLWWMILKLGLLQQVSWELEVYSSSRRCSTSHCQWSQSMHVSNSHISYLHIPTRLYTSSSAQKSRGRQAFSALLSSTSFKRSVFTILKALNFNCLDSSALANWKHTCLNLLLLIMDPSVLVRSITTTITMLSNV